MSKLAIALLLAAAAWAADPAGFRIWKADQLTKSGKRLAPKIDANKLAGESLGEFGNHAASITHREGNGEAEVHAGMTDIFVIQSGGGTVVIGGKVAKSRTTGPGEIRGPSIDGGTKHAVAPGDILHIPAGTPHQVLVESGKETTYFVVKVAK